MKQWFAEVILPLPLHGAFTYIIPNEIGNELEIGKRVIIQFGKKKFYSAIVSKIHDTKPDGYELKEIISILDEKPIIYTLNILFWRWVADYYCCSMGEVMKAALPSGLKLESLSKIKVADSHDTQEVSIEESNILNFIGNGSKTIREIEKAGLCKSTFSLVQQMLDKKYLCIEEKIAMKYKARSQAYVSFYNNISSEELLSQKIDGLKKAKKQAELLIHFCDVTKAFTPGQKNEVAKKDLLKGANSNHAVLKGLSEKKILKVFYKEVSRLDENQAGQGELNLLNPYQEKALNEIQNHFKSKNTVLLHGITSSGKTEIYTHLIGQAINKGKQVLYLVPEISLTTQLISRLKRVFGVKVGVYHSRLNDSERAEIWMKVCSASDNSYRIILGTRSSVFLPFNNLGLIVVDEEHENSFKQFDPAPRYNARDLAVVMGIKYNAKVLLGTATPSFETYYNVRAGRFGLVKLMQRHGGLELPNIIVSDLQRAYKRKQMKSVLAPELFGLISESLDKNEQVILFQNRRGYAPFIECMHCGWVPKCERCDVSLTYHKYRKQLVCHYCGYYIHLPEKCHECGSPEMKARGLGTEKIEDELKQLFPLARIARMDLDTTRTRNAFEKIINKLENREIDILVGTQMVTKGLDFEHVNVVGILNADNLLNFPDFRAHERSFQLLSQVSGRAGRKHKQGAVVIQTSQPQHPVINEVKNSAFLETYTRQLNERKFFNYPPFFRLIKIVVKHKNPDKLNTIAGQLSEMLRQNKHLIVLGPEYPLISRVSLWYHKEIWVKLNKDNQLVNHKKWIISAIRKIKEMPGNSGATYNIDVDPM